MLGFLKPFALYGLAAAFLPLLIHLFARPRLKKIRFSTLAFFQQIETKRAQSFKLQQFLVLLFRTLAIIFLVLALARPTLRNAGPNGNARTTAFMILDNSLSMSRNHLYETAQKQCSDILSTLHPGDEAALFLTDGTRFPAAGSTGDFESLRAAIMKSEASYMRSTLQPAILRAQRELQVSPHANQEIYLLSDFQATAVLKNPDSLFTPISNIHWFAWPVQSETSNLAVTDCRIASQIMQPDSPVEVEASIQNFSESPVEDALVRLSLGDRAVAQQSFSSGPGQTTRLRFQVHPDRGWFWGRAALDEDVLTADNQTVFAGFMPGKIFLLLIGDAASRKRMRLVLDLQSGETLFAVQESDRIPQQHLQPEKIQVVCLLDVSEITMQNAEVLSNFVVQGGGLCFIPGSKTDVDQFNKTLGSAFSLSFQNPQREVDQRSFLTLGALNRSHLLFNGMFGDKPDFTSPRFFRTLECQVPRHNIVQFYQNQSSFLIEKRLGSGKALLFTSGFDAAWSDLEWSAFFAPLMLRSVYYLSQSENKIPQIRCGETLIFPLENADLAEDYFVEKPSGETVLLHPIRHGGSFAIETDAADEPGLYKLLRGEQLAGLGIVRIDPLESDLIPADREAIASLAPGLMHFISDNPEETILQARWGREFWTLCLLLAVLFLLAEMAVIRWMVRQAA